MPHVPASRSARRYDPGSGGPKRSLTVGDVVGPRWLAQDARPTRLTDVDFGALPVELRLLLIHDGTLTTALEAYQLAPIIADVNGQQDVLLEPEYAGWLNAPPGAPAVRRSTTLRHRITGRLLVQCDDEHARDSRPSRTSQRSRMPAQIESPSVCRPVRVLRL